MTCLTCNSSDNRQLNSSTLLCDPIDGFYDDGTNNSMVFPCDSACLTCSESATYCTSCNSSDNRQLNPNTSLCEPMDGFYDDGTNNSMALPCSDSCLTCKLGPNQCINCVNDTFAINPSNQNCDLCSTFLINCGTCSSS
jgi:hypothetical protein